MGVDRLPSRRWEVDWKVDVFSPCPAEGSQRARWRGTPPPAVNSPLTTDPKLSIPGTRGELYCKKKRVIFGNILLQPFRYFVMYILAILFF